jgi:hypothetical protein
MFAAVLAGEYDSSQIVTGGGGGAAAPAPELLAELTSLLRTVAMKARAVGPAHRSLAPTLGRLAEVLSAAGDVASTRDCLAHRLAVVEREAVLELKDLRRLAGAVAGTVRGVFVCLLCVSLCFAGWGVKGRVFWWCCVGGGGA